MDRRRDGLSFIIRSSPPGWGCDRSRRSGAKTHVGWRGDLPPQGGLFTSDEAGMDRKRRGEGSHGNIVGVLDGRFRGCRSHPGTKVEVFKPLSVNKMSPNVKLLRVLSNLSATGGSVVAALMET